MKTTTLANGRKALEFTVQERKWGDTSVASLCAVMYRNQLVIAERPTLDGKTRRAVGGDLKKAIECYGNVVTGRATFEKVMTQGGIAKVKSGYGNGARVPGTNDQRYATLKVELKGSRVKITAPCGAVVVMTRAKADRLLAAVKEL